MEGNKMNKKEMEIIITNKKTNANFILMAINVKDCTENRFCIITKDNKNLYFRKEIFDYKIV